MKMLEDLAEVVRNDHEKCPNFWAAIEFIRTHHATIRDMAARLESAERDAANIREVVKDWLDRADKLELKGNMFSGSTILGIRDCAKSIDAAMQEAGR